MPDFGIVSNFFLDIIDIIYVALIIGTIVVILLDNRNPVKTMAWLLVLIFLPIVGLIFYFFFGRNTRKERLISKRSLNRIMKRPMAEFLAQESFDFSGEPHQLIRLFEKTSQSLPYADNYLEIYTTGYTKLQSFIRELYKAKDHIHVEYYIFNDDAVGRLVRDVLIDKAREGVEVRVLHDDVGCWSVKKDFFEEMRGEGIEVRSFLKVRFPLFTSRVNYRNHRKIVVIDGKTGFVGGMNLADRYIQGFTWGIWRDTHLLIKGKAVYGLQTAFLMDWYFVDRTLLTSSRYFPKQESKGESLIQVVTSDPIGEWKEIMQGLAYAINNAKKYFYIQTPYFLPTESIMAALQTAALSGVDVRVMLPVKSDSKFTNFGSRSYLKDVVKAGVKVYFYKKGFLHSKLMVSDDMISTVGSTNMDFRSFENNFEVNAFIYNADVARKMKNIFLQDQKDSELLILKTWEQRPLLEKALESVIRVLSPLL